jgi:hypothetical protein
MLILSGLAVLLLGWIGLGAAHQIQPVRYPQWLQTSTMIISGLLVVLGVAVKRFRR